MRFFYNLFIAFYWLLIRCSVPFNRKARQWMAGRKHVLDKMKKEIERDTPLIWFHCASLGEFEQGRPVLESVRQVYPDHKILLTFFSPSGYENQKNYPGADYIYYLPMDTRSNARRFIQLARPRLVFFIKYEFWFNYINQLYQNTTPTFVVSAIFRKSQHFFQPWGGWSRKQLQKITYFFVQNEKSLALLRMIKVHHADISGDTRFDRVIALAKNHLRLPVLERFGKDHKLIVAGSTWPADEDLLFKLMQDTEQDFRLVIAPHEVHREHISQIVNKFGQFNPLLYSAVDKEDLPDSRILIIDSIGILASAYSYAYLAYIGGGFGVGIHNTIEAAAYGIPVIFGPNYRNFMEAVGLVSAGGGFSINGADECKALVEKLVGDPSAYELSASTAGDFVRSQAGATDRVIDKAREFMDGE